MHTKGIGRISAFLALAAASATAVAACWDIVAVNEILPIDCKKSNEGEPCGALCPVFDDWRPGTQSEIIESTGSMSLACRNGTIKIGDNTGECWCDPGAGLSTFYVGVPSCVKACTTGGGH
jgi:hypothetical protein